MLSKEKRLNRALFTTISSQGKRVHSDHFTLVYTKGEAPRFSFVVSKKNGGGAVMRNTLRRIVYSQLQDVTEPVNGIFFAKKGIKKGSPEIIRAEIGALIKKAR